MRVASRRRKGGMSVSEEHDKCESSGREEAGTNSTPTETEQKDGERVEKRDAQLALQEHLEFLQSEHPPWLDGCGHAMID